MRGVYIIQMGTVYKIGHTGNLKARVASVLSSLPFGKLLHVIPSDESLWIERSLHERYAHRRVNGEWFTLTDEERDEIIAMTALDFGPEAVRSRIEESKRQSVERPKFVTKHETHLFTAERICALRRYLNMTIPDFASYFGVSEATVLSWESGRRHPKYAHHKKLSRLARSLNGAVS